MTSVCNTCSIEVVGGDVDLGEGLVLEFANTHSSQNDPMQLWTSLGSTFMPCTRFFLTSFSMLAQLRCANLACQSFGVSNMVQATIALWEAPLGRSDDGSGCLMIMSLLR